MFLLVLVIACSGAPEPAAEAPAPAPSAPAAAPEPAAGPTAGGRIGGSPILDRLVVLGGLDNAAVEAALAAGKPQTDACFREPDGTRPSRMGKVLVRFMIGPDGAVTKTETRSTSLRHAPTETCLNEAVSALSFPAPSKGSSAIVMAPFSFPPR